MYATEPQLFTYSDLSTIAPWLTPEACYELVRTGLFAPRFPVNNTVPDSPHMSIYDLIALTAVQQVLRCGISASAFRQALYDPSSFRCDDLAAKDLLFLGTAGVRGQELPRFLELNHAQATALIRYPLGDTAHIAFVPNDLLGANDYTGVTLAGIECRAIRDLIEANMASSSTFASAHQSEVDPPQLQNSSS